MNMLEKAIADASQKYYTDGSSGISDAKFDNMMNQLKKEKPDSPLITAVGHGYDVNLDTTPGKKYRHKYGSIGSLDKCHSFDELPTSIKAKWNDYLYASLKLDGLSVVMYYENGILVQALTRGRDNIGIDITPKVLRILKKSEIDDKTFTGSVRGEIIMSFKNFECFSQMHPEASNARNSAAGLINSTDITDEIDLLDIIVYRVIGDENGSVLYNSYTQMCIWLERNFEKTAPVAFAGSDDLTFDEYMKKLADQWYGNYPSDGIVLTVGELKRDADMSYQYESVAYKFQAEIKETEVIDVEWSLSKTGYMIPRVRIKPTLLSGATVSYTSGFHAKYILDNHVGPGALISICRSGEVIPDIQEVIESSSNVSLPTTCLSCGSELVWNGVHLKCENASCSGQAITSALIWMKTIAPTDGLGDTLIVKFLTDTLGENISVDAIYEHGKLTENDNPSVQYRKFAAAFNELFTKNIDLKTAIQACNIPRFGDVTAGKLAQYSDAVRSWLATDCCLDAYDDVFQNAKIGTADRESLIDNRNKLLNLKYISSQIMWDSHVDQLTGGIKVAITGKLSVTRSVFEKELREKGFVPGNISADTKYLITDCPTGQSSKNKFADAHGIEKISEAEFRTQFM